MARSGNAGARADRLKRSQGGFTLATLIVLLTIISIFIAYTVPKQWSIVLGRERDKQTIFIMKQYAQAIRNFQQKNGNAFPTSLDQIKKARSPRLIRGKGEWPDPLTGEVDWIPIPAQAAPQGPPAPPRVPGQPWRMPSTPVGTNPTGLPGPQQNASIGNFVGPIGGVRPARTGKSYIALNGADSYEQWSYTTIDLQNETTARINAIVSTK